MMTNDKKLSRLSFWIAMTMIIHMAMFQVLGASAVMLESVLYGVMNTEATAHIIGQSIYALCYFLSFAVPTWIFCGVAHRREEYRKGFYRGGIPASLPLIVLAVIALNFVAAYVNQALLLELFPDAWGETSVGPYRDYEIIMMIVTTAVVPAIVEEMLFRGAILSNLLPFGRSMAILASAVLFGLMHGNPLQFFYTTLMGVVLCVIYVKTKSIYVCMIIHFLNNFTSIMQTVLLQIPDQNLGNGWYMGIEVVILVMGALSLLYFLRRYLRRPHPEQNGSFGTVLEPHADYAVYPVTRGKRLALLFSPAMIVYVILALAMMALVLFGMVLAGGISYV